MECQLLYMQNLIIMGENISIGNKEKVMIIHIYNLLNAPKITEFLIRY